MKLDQLAKRVAESQKSGREMDKLTLSNPELTVNQAYEIQKLSINETITGDNRFIGWKMGLTSKAKQKQVGVEEAIYGRLTSAMELTKPVLKVGELIHPRVEPEFAFLFKDELKGANITVKDVWPAVECVFLALEVIDSRYKKFSFTLTDVVADNASSAKILLSNQAYSPYHTDWAQAEVTLYQNGEMQKRGLGEAVLDHPIHSIVELVKMISREGLSIQAGMIVLVGGITDAVTIQANDEIIADYGELGKLTLHVIS
ncbi:fumarylacetoacetate hydrolase family protein [Peribacillus simplex]|uniref:2-keto-4-pentenoate hydratase n=1 Tax=Peribacillus simplex TaxID=1478 RepID=UPI003D283C18